MKPAISPTVLKILRDPEGRDQFDRLTSKGLSGSVRLSTGEVIMVNPTGNRRQVVNDHTKVTSTA